MDSSVILHNIYQTIPLTEEEQKVLESILISRPFKQGELIVKSGDPARYIMFVHAGYIMTYHTDKEGADYVVQFSGKGWWSGDMYGLSKEAATPYSTKGLCDGELLLIPRLALDHLFEKYPVFERYFRITFQNSFIRNQMRFLEIHSATAAERYESFINRFPGMEQYVPQKHIASFLGITPEFLSKIRKQNASRKS